MKLPYEARLRMVMEVSKMKGHRIWSHRTGSVIYIYIYISPEFIEPPNIGMDPSPFGLPEIIIGIHVLICRVYFKGSEVNTWFLEGPL